ncbi:hypothetical protein GS943_18875 [Rhodococcus hoagii]|nr:hypothetical protein [Prescottella equi]
MPDSAATGTAVQLAATVAPAGASGTVQFRDGGANIGAPVPVVDGSASLSYAFGSLGAHSITAVYSGGAGFASSTSEARTVTVTPPVVATSTTVTVPPTATTDLAVDLVAAVTPVGASGTVQFKDGASEIGAPVPVTGGVATLPHAFTTTGAHSVTAVYSGGAGFGPSTSSARTVTVSEPMPDAVATVTTLTAPGAAEVGSPVTLSATVSPAPVDGTVQFPGRSDESRFSGACFGRSRKPAPYLHPGWLARDQRGLQRWIGDARFLGCAGDRSRHRVEHRYRHPVERAR